MDEDTTTGAEVQETGADEALPVQSETTDTADVQDTTDSGETQEETEAEEHSASEPDAKLKKYAVSQGIDLDSPNAIKAAQIAMKAQSEATKRYQKSSELEKAATTISDEDATASATATGQNPELLKRLQRVEVRESVREFWQQDGIDKAYEPAMIELLKTKPYLAGDLESLYATAVMKSGGVAAVKSQGKREALESLARKQQAAVPAGNATTTAKPKAKAFKDLSIAEMEKQLGFAKR